MANPVIKLVLPLDIVPSTNDKVRVGRTGVFASGAETRRLRDGIYEHVIGYLVNCEHPTRLEAYNIRGSKVKRNRIIVRLIEPLVKYSRVIIHSYNNQRDIDGHDIKTVFDAITDAKVWQDDRFIEEYTVRRHRQKDTLGRRLEIEIFKLAGPLKD